MPFIRSISGLRATLQDGLIPETVTKYASSFSNISPEGTIIIGRDGRTSGKWLEKLIVGAINATGRDVTILGMVPTPLVQYYTEVHHAAGGIAITASHNPKEWNGMKFINSSGVFLDATENALLWDRVDTNNIYLSDNEIFPENRELKSPSREFIRALLGLDLFTKTDLLDKIKERQFKVVVDAVNASGSFIVPELLKELNCQVIELYCKGNGIFPHTPEPITDNLTDLANAVKHHGADLGIAVDPDADRLVLINNLGKAIGEEKTLAISALSVFSNLEYFTNDTKNVSVVVNHSTSKMTYDIAKKYNAQCLSAPVGEINVVKKMKESGAIFGGEGSGGVILPAMHYGRDSLVGIVLTLSLLAQNDVSLEELATILPKYEMIKLKKAFTGKLDSVINTIIQKYPNAELIKEDGIKLNFNNSWVQLRTSNTEPIIRVIAEASTQYDALGLANEVMELV